MAADPAKMQQPPLATATASPNGTAEDATSLRERGNALYKSGRVQQAIDLYQQAVAAASPDDPLPFSNLSAAQYEIGRYQEAISSAQKALSRGQSRDDIFKQKLDTRISQAAAQLQCVNSSAGFTDLLHGSESVFVAAHRRIKESHSLSSGSVAWTRLIRDAPHLKPALQVSMLIFHRT